jgi:hypothetical protein
MLWINLVALVAAVAGFARGWKAIHKMRLPARAEGALLSWEENPPSVFRYDGYSGAAITVHALAVALLSLVLLEAVNRAAPHPWSFEFRSPSGRWLESLVGREDPQMHYLSGVAGGLAAGIAGYILGALLSFPIVRWRVRPVRVHILSGGILYGSTHYPWPEIGHWYADPGRRLIGLFTRARPRMLSVVLRPPTPELYAAVEGHLQAQMPGERGPRRATWDRRRAMFALAGLGGIAVLLLIAFWTRSYVAEWVWLLLGIEIVALERAAQLLATV